MTAAIPFVSIPSLNVDLSSVSMKFYSCAGCGTVRSLDTMMYECIHCTGSFCPSCTCDCDEDKIPVSMLLSKARNLLTMHMMETPERLSDPLVFVVADEEGGSLAVQGDVKGIIGEEVIIEDIFADQLPKTISRAYNKIQLSVWADGPRRVHTFPLIPMWCVAIFPILIAGQRFTVTHFTRSLLSEGIM